VKQAILNRTSSLAKVTDITNLRMKLVVDEFFCEEWIFLWTLVSNVVSQRSCFSLQKTISTCLYNSFPGKTRYLNRVMKVNAMDVSCHWACAFVARTQNASSRSL